MQIFLVLFLMIDKTVITTCNRGNQCVSHVLGHVRTSGPTLHSCKKIPECITSFDRTDLANVIILQLSFCCPSFVATFGVTHPSCNPYCWPGPSGRWGVRWVWLASTTWEWWGSKGRGGTPWVTARDAEHNGARVLSLDRSQRCSFLLNRRHCHRLVCFYTGQNQEEWLEEW